MKDAVFSYEFFPPGNAVSERRFWRSLGYFETMEPAFYSITYGAFGSGQTRSVTTIENVIAECSVPIAAHLTFEGSTKEEINAVAKHFAEIGVSRIVALRGDDRENAADALKRGSCYRNVAEFIAGLVEIYPFDISVACYPEVHPKAKNAQADIQELKAKCDAGADRAISQFFFDADTFERFRDQVAAAGISIPIVAGVLPIRDFNKMTGFAAKCGAHVPQRLVELFAGVQKNPELAARVGEEEVERFVGDLLERDCSHFHIYTMNQSIDFRQRFLHRQLPAQVSVAIA